MAAGTHLPPAYPFCPGEAERTLIQSSIAGAMFQTFEIVGVSQYGTAGNQALHVGFGQDIPDGDDFPGDES